MKTLSVKHPWCELIASGEKTVEIRTWKTDYRGPLLIASSAAPKWALAGKAVCIVDLVDVRPITQDDLENSCCSECWDSDYAWILENARTVPAIPIKGKLHLYDTEV